MRISSSERILEEMACATIQTAAYAEAEYTITIRDKLLIHPNTILLLLYTVRSNKSNWCDEDVLFLFVSDYLRCEFAARNLLVMR